MAPQVISWRTPTPPTLRRCRQTMCPPTDGELGSYVTGTPALKDSSKFWVQSNAIDTEPNVCSTCAMGLAFLGSPNAAQPETLCTCPVVSVSPTWDMRCSTVTGSAPLSVNGSPGIYPDTAL